MENLKIIVVGAGMGGLTTALAMKQAGYQVEIYDRVRELRPAGAGISLWSNGVKVLNRLGLGKEIAAIWTGSLLLLGSNLKSLYPCGDE